MAKGWFGAGREGKIWSPASGAGGAGLVEAGPHRMAGCGGRVCVPQGPGLWGGRAGSRAERAGPWGCSEEEQQSHALGLGHERGRGCAQAQGVVLPARVRRGELCPCPPARPGLDLSPASRSLLRAGTKHQSPERGLQRQTRSLPGRCRPTEGLASPDASLLGL